MEKVGCFVGIVSRKDAPKSSFLKREPKVRINVSLFISKRTRESEVTNRYYSIYDNDTPRFTASDTVTSKRV